MRDFDHIIDVDSQATITYWPETEFPYMAHLLTGANKAFKTYAEAAAWANERGANFSLEEPKNV